jgi:hypothetical protein
LYASDFLAWRNDTEFLLAAAVNESSSKGVANDGAICLLLKAGDDNAPINLIGWSFANDPETANKKALKMAKIDSSDVRCLYDSQLPISAGLYSLINAIISPEDKDKRPILINNHSQDSMGMAVIVERK